MHLAKARANKAKDSTDRTRTRRTGQGQEQGQEQGFGSRLELCQTWTLLKRLLEQEEHQQGDSKGKHKPKSAYAHNLDSKPSIPEVEIDEFSMTYLNVDALQESEMRGSEWIKIGVDTGAGKTAWLQSITYGKTILGDSDLTFRTATGELVKGGKRMHVVGCDDWGSNLKIRGVQARVCKTTVVCWRIHNKGWSHCVVW